MLDVVRALGYGHGLTENGAPIGFVHRDVSPENVMVSYAGATKLIDFGAAATANSPPPSSSVVGKLRYLSPERLRGNVGDARSDLYSVGIMLYEYLTGISPFDGQDMVKKIIEGQAPDITTKVNVSPAVARVVRRAMAADLRKRYGWADRLADELSMLLSSDLGHDPYGADEGDVLELLRKAGAASHEQQQPATPDGQSARLRAIPTVGGPAPPPVAAAPVESPPARSIASPAVAPAPSAEGARTSARRGTPRPAAAKPAISLDDVSIWQLGASPPAPKTPAPARHAVTMTPATLSDPFSVVRRAGVNPVAAWFRDTPPEAALRQPAPTTHLNEDEAVAAACFDRGLSLVSERRPLDAVLYWERAVALAPSVVMYQEQLRQLVTQIRDQREIGGSPTPTPRRTSIR